MRVSGPVDPLSVDLDAVDLVDPRTYAHGDPHPVWHALRARDPVRWHPVGSGGFWSVTTYDDASYVLRDHTAFTSERGTLLSLLGKDDPAGGRQMAATDPPRHTRMRAPLQRALTIKAVERSTGLIAEQVRRLLAPARSGEPFDLAEALTQLPMAVAGMLMGLPQEDWPRLTRLTLMAIAADDPEYMSQETPEATVELAHRELFAYFAEIVRLRRRTPGDDLISLLMTTAVDGEPLGPGEVLSNCYSLLLGANVTTPYVPLAAFDSLLGTPALEDLLRPRSVADALEEALRWASPANHFMRHARHDVELGAVKIRAGDAVVVWLGSANRDEKVFADPYTFDARRKPNRHMAFGSGAHYCVGHTVARVSLRTLLTELGSGFSDFERAGETEHLSSNFVAGIKHLVVTAKVRKPGD
ncbi:cytochrome P450 [Streptomyces albicerus]|uniref:cytochrome P450 n=1 Tax=Streptomyces albicerus TaxID=2569859 RepID=UPI00124BBB84|nr:cytochrome P450 [Streptomyces albicerus]